MILRKYLLSSVFRSPDEPAEAEPAPAGDTPAADPVVGQDPPAADPAADPAGEPEPPAAADPAQHGNKGKTPWYMARISEETTRRNAEAEARQAAERRAADAEAMLQRLQSGKPGDAPAPRTDPAAPQPQPEEFTKAVKAQAAYDRFIEDTKDVRAAGDSEIPGFSESLGILGAVGATTDEFVADVLAVDKANAHKILDKLAKDPEVAARLVGLDSRRRTVELTKMSLAEQKPAPAPKPAPAAEPAKPAISRAPTPKPVVAPHAAAPEVDPRTPEGNEKMSDADFERWYKSTYMKRAG